jgi:hypothetical protein
MELLVMFCEVDIDKHGLFFSFPELIVKAKLMSDDLW